MKIGKHLKKFGSDPVFLKGPYEGLNDKLVECKLIHGQAKSKFGSGWREFVRKYQLAEGDVCAFKFHYMNQRIVDIMIAFAD